MAAATEQIADRSPAVHALPWALVDCAEGPEVLIDQDAGRVLVRDRGETFGYELRMRSLYGGRGSGLGWVELVLGIDGAVSETVSAAEVMAIARDAGRDEEAAEISRRVASQFVESEDAAAKAMGDRLLQEVRDGNELERVSLRALQHFHLSCTRQAE